MTIERIIEEHLDDRGEDQLEYERTGHVVIVIPFLGDVECEGAGWYE
jgi:hypothetical protein